jgi:chromate reductase
MNKINVITVIGGISKDSLNKRAYSEIVKNNPSSVNFGTFDIASLPFYSQDMENDPPASVREFQLLAGKADAALFITPEYNRSFPGVLKNAIDWATRPYGQNLWQGKPAAVMGVSVGKMGAFGAVQHLKNVCNFLDMRLMNQPEVYIDASSVFDGNGLTPQSVPFIRQFVLAFEEWIKTFRKM